MFTEILFSLWSFLIQKSQIICITILINYIISGQVKDQNNRTNNLLFFVSEKFPFKSVKCLYFFYIGYHIIIWIIKPQSIRYLYKHCYNQFRNNRIGSIKNFVANFIIYLKSLS